MSRGRKVLPPVEKVGPQLGHLTHEAAAEEAAGKALDIGALEQAGALIQIGRIQMADFNQKMNRVAAAREFQQMRESNGYKDLPYRDASGNVRRVADVDEFCEVFLGRSYRSVAEDAQNLNLLGDELYEHALALGLTTRNFREIRSLAQDDQALVKEAIESKSREAVIEILETVVTKHAKEKRGYEKRLKDIEGDLEAQRKVALKKDEKLNALDAKLHKRLADLPAQLQELQIDCVTAANEVINAIQKFTQVRDAAMKLLNGDKRDRNDDTVLETVGVTHLKMIWQAQAYLTEELDWSEHLFGSYKTKIEIRMHDKTGPELTDEQIMNLRNAGADEAIRVAGPRVVEAYIERDADRAAKKKTEEEMP